MEQRGGGVYLPSYRKQTIDVVPLLARLKRKAVEEERGRLAGVTLLFG